MTQSFSQIYPWQQADWQHLQAYRHQQRIPQALLFSGPAGVGKRQLAEVFARLLLCQAPQQDLPCGVCPACELLQAQTHSDYLSLEPDAEGKVIGVDKIRQLIAKLALTPQYAGYRTVIIAPADRLNSAAANAFLKCLEEPPERSCFLLISDQPGLLPATVRSRCQKLQVQCPDPQLAMDWLAGQGVNADSGQLLKLAQGAPLLAKVYAEQNILQLRRDTFTGWLQVGQGKANLVQLAEQWHKYDTQTLDLILAWLSVWLADIVKLRHGADIANPDFAAELQSLAARLDLPAVYAHYDRVLRSKALLPTQLNRQLQAEQLLIDWRQLHG
ncbi:DNA polymerase III subunit delta' [Methylomonas paludis]|uniref:DNA polymerase III subunit delta' n=1 Tax=Methylomonas paludis TaxID=1173101 RepID=A0A975MP70_9GAMM|nr:DNA polymerase III subunit delta' [Methylomonas paludis]QWF71483.1 DNA polymerase III subunit delta' [Methylomonas paludis]